VFRVYLVIQLQVVVYGRSSLVLVGARLTAAVTLNGRGA
jgi:hypothetical protein